MRRNIWLFVLTLFLAGICPELRAGQYKLNDGTVLDGEPLPNTEGLVVRLESGGFSTRVPWQKFSQESLRQMAENPALKAYVEPFIELTPEELKPKEPKAPIPFRPPNRLERPDPHAQFSAIFVSPVTWFIVGLVYLANIFAGFEVAVFRSRPAALVCGLSVILPILAPLIFLCLPTRIPPPPEPLPQAAAQAPAHIAMPSHAEATPAPAAPAALALAPGSPAQGQGTVFVRGQFTFNRRFFETKLPGFLKPAPGPAEKDMVLVFKTLRGEYVGTRISRIFPNELYLQEEKGGASAEARLPFNEINEVHLRHKDNLPSPA